MTKDEALKLALEALKQNHYYMIDAGLPNQSMLNKNFDAMITIKEALAQPEQEPVAWMNDMGTHIDLNVSNRGTPLYTTLPQRTWVGLTDEEVGNLSDFAYANDEEFVRNVEKHLKEKNSG